jgi:hypothetical protein
MKKPKKTSKAQPSKAKSSRSAQKKPSNPVLDMFKNMDEDTIAMLRQAFQEGLDLEPGLFGPEDPVDLFVEYIEACTQADVHDEELNELAVELVDTLGNLRIASNGGDREAREQILAVLDLLDDAIENCTLDGVYLIVTAKILADAGWDVPGNLKQAVAASLQNAEPGEVDLTETDLVSSLMEMADASEKNPFDLHEELNSLVAGLPAEASIMLLSELIGGRKAFIDQAVAGFFLYPDIVVAQSVGEALAASAAQTPVSSTLIEWLVRMRPWLPPARQVHLDATIRAMRLNALPPVKADLPKVIKCYASLCDGSGTSSLFVTQRVGKYYQVASVMRKSTGVAEGILLRELAKSEMDDMVRRLKSAVPTMETDLVGVARILALAIADNFASGNLPPFKLVEVVEVLGLGPIHPDPASPAEIIEELLAHLPFEQTDPVVVARAHADMLGSEFEDQWFEAGEELEDFLYPIKGSKHRVAKLMKDYLPRRRSFWARQCALSALAMRGDSKTRDPLWKRLALVGRDIASDMPLNQIPLMEQIAETSVRIFESGL